MTDWLFPYLPKNDILEAYRKAGGDELDSGNVFSPESSAALAANTFGYFLHKPEDFPPVPAFGAVDWPAQRIALEECLRFPWSGGKHPWLDAVVETKTHLIGIESKRYEPIRPKDVGSFSKAYWRPRWGDVMGPFERLRDRLHERTLVYERLDAVQLVKHAFGLRTQGHKRGLSPVLVYLYAEPSSWPDGRLIDEGLREQHREEIRDFAQAAGGAEVRFVSCTYRELLDAFADGSTPEVAAHGAKVAETFRPLWPEMS